MIEKLTDKERALQQSLKAAADGLATAVAERETARAELEEAKLANERLRECVNDRERAELSALGEADEHAADLKAARADNEALRGRLREAERLLAVLKPVFEVDRYRLGWFTDRDAFLASPPATEPRGEATCPGSNCMMCTGEACDFCGAGCWNNDPDRAKCEHDVIQRHQRPPAAPASAQGTTGETLSQALARQNEDFRRQQFEARQVPPVTRVEFDALDARVAALEVIEEKYEAMAKRNHDALQERIDRAKAKPAEPPQPAPPRSRKGKAR